MARLGAPGDFIKKLPAPLQLATVNYLLCASNDNAGATLRLRGDEVAAIVSGRYAPLDPVELVETIRDALVKHGMLHEVRVRGVASGLVDNLRLVLGYFMTSSSPWLSLAHKKSKRPTRIPVPELTYCRMHAVRQGRNPDSSRANRGLSYLLQAPLARTSPCGRARRPLSSAGDRVTH